jgi:hypothetical protein
MPRVRQATVWLTMSWAARQGVAGANGNAKCLTFFKGVGRTCPRSAPEWDRSIGGHCEFDAGGGELSRKSCIATRKSNANLVFNYPQKFFSRSLEIEILPG